MKGLFVTIAIWAAIIIQIVAFTKDETPGFYLYVFDREKEVWNRATIEDLKHATCQDLRIFPAHPMMTAKSMMVVKEE